MDEDGRFQAEEESLRIARLIPFHWEIPLKI